MKSPLVIALIAVTLGCSSSDSRSARSGAEKKATAKKPAPAPKPAVVVQSAKVDPQAFPDIPTAVQALQTAAVEDRSEDVLKAENWLALQGPAAVAPLGEIFNNEQAPPAGRIVACRVLRRLGPPAKPVLKKGLDSPSEQIRLNAIKALSVLRPTDAEIIDTLVGLMDNQPERIRREAILALATIGEPAQAKCADKLLAVLNDNQAEPTLRDAAKLALKKVMPRKRLTDR